MSSASQKRHSLANVAAALLPFHFSIEPGRTRTVDVYESVDGRAMKALEGTGSPLTIISSVKWSSPVYWVQRPKGISAAAERADICHEQYRLENHCDSERPAARLPQRGFCPPTTINLPFEDSNLVGPFPATCLRQAYAASVFHRLEFAADAYPLMWCVPSHNLSKALTEVVVQGYAATVFWGSARDIRGPCTLMKMKLGILNRELTYKPSLLFSHTH